MPKIRGKIAAFELMGSGLSADLASFLDLAWSHRKNTRTGTYSAGNADVYGLYARAGRGTTPPAAILNFLREILQFPLLPEIQASPKDPLGGYLVQNCGARQPPSGFLVVSREGFIKMIQLAEKYPNLRDRLGSTFYHFRRGGGRHSAERLYLHAHPLRATKVMRFVLDQMIMRPTVHPDMTNGKTGAPGKETRFDTLVLYFATKDGLQKGTDEIAAFQQARNNRTLFDHGTTRSTLAITKHKGIDLVGVSTGAEPPIAVQQQGTQLVLLPKSTSFGTFRSTLISFALTKTLEAKEGKPEFIARVIRYFKSAGINPRQPHEHGNAVELQHRAQVTLKQLKAGKEPTWGFS